MLCNTLLLLRTSLWHRSPLALAWAAASARSKAHGSVLEAETQLVAGRSGDTSPSPAPLQVGICLLSLPLLSGWHVWPLLLSLPDYRT